MDHPVRPERFKREGKWNVVSDIFSRTIWVLALDNHIADVATLLDTRPCERGTVQVTKL
ncbi:MAG: hypothetical protein P8L79_06945 [Rhodospirillaceae bacterium]|nr:hypothetical protein [Rhodospirillaceae bacterium]